MNRSTVSVAAGPGVGRLGLVRQVATSPVVVGMLGFRTDWIGNMNDKFSLEIVPNHNTTVTN
jgi:hypothetical protein